MQKGIVLYNEKIAKDIFKIIFKTELKEVLSGQFVSILCPPKVLRRPFSTANFENGQITCLYKVIGEGTKYIKSLKPGKTLDFIAPLGNAFKYGGKTSALLIGAGIGIAPMLLLKKELCFAKIKNFLITGFKSDDEAAGGSDKTIIGGSVTDYVPDLINEYKPDVIYSCGPLAVLKTVSALGKKAGIETQIAMEKIMACGIGVCRGCVIRLKNGQNASICKDGPVFYGESVVWD